MKAELGESRCDLTVTSRGTGERSDSFPIL